jgi:hypothetical protein
MSDLDRRVADLEARAGPADDPVVILELIYGDDSKPSPALVAQAEAWGRAHGRQIVTVSRGRTGDGEWEIEGADDENTQQG